MVNRGIQLYNNLFEDEQEVIEAPKQNVSRDAQLIAARNEFLFHRFYFKSKVERKFYHDCIKELSGEVFLSKITLQKLIQGNAEDIMKIKKQAPSPKDLLKKYPWVNW